mgnify:FL=1|tara:strand:- start:618 stop:830 length:213 start_codon:yes stop_codon:yes gene_type:complete
MASKVFGCDDLRKEILSYIPKYCGECKGRMGNINFPKGIKQYRNYIWRINECKHMKGYCNWCYYYVYEYN